MNSTRVIVFIVKFKQHIFFALVKLVDFDVVLNIILDMWDSTRFVFQQPC